MADTTVAAVRGHAPTVEWLRQLRVHHFDLAHDIGRGLINGSRFFSVEAYERTMARAAELFPWMYITQLYPWPWVPQGVLGEPCPDISTLGFRCEPKDAMAADILLATMLPQGRKRVACSYPPALESVRVRRSDGADSKEGSITVTVSKIRDDLDDSHPLAMFRPSAIRRARPVAQPRGTAISIASGTGLRLVVDNTQDARS
jgi:hypothetical protein